MDIDDVHLCCHCQKTFMGLETYVKHRKDGCKSKTRTKTDTFPENPKVLLTSLSKASGMDISSLLAMVSQVESEKNDPMVNNSDGLRVSNCLSVSTQGRNSNHAQICVQASNLDHMYLPSSPQANLTTEQSEAPSKQTDKNNVSFVNFPPPVNTGYKTNSYSCPMQTPSLLSPGLNTDHLDDHFILASVGHGKDTSEGNSSMNPTAQTAASVDDFFSSLELKHRVPEKDPVNQQHFSSPQDEENISEPQQQEVEHIEEAPTVEVYGYEEKESEVPDKSPSKPDTFEVRLRNIKISNLLNDLDFSSGSESLPSDVDELLNFSDDEYYRDERPVLGGKWKPGSLSAYHNRSKGKVSGKLASHLRHAGKNLTTGGKWKPGAGPPTTSQGKHGVRHGGGKQYSYKRIKGLTDSEDEVEQETSEQVNSESPKKNKNDSSKCVTCSKTFSSPYYLANHIKTVYHKKRVAAAARKKPPKRGFECPFCKVWIKRKENYIHHLSVEMKRLNKNVDDIEIPEAARKHLMWTRKFQCRICCFSCQDAAGFTDHLISQLHVENCTELLGPILCVRCSFSCDSNAKLMEHFQCTEHTQNVMTSNRACVVKESRTQVQCKQCDKVCRSATKLELHILSVHSGQNKPFPREKGVRHKPTCPCCNKTWESASALEIHLARKRSDKPFQCLICKISFSTNSDLTRHCQSEKHLDEAVQLGTAHVINPQEPRKAPAPSDRRKGYLCKWDGCDFRAAKRKQLKLHYKQHTAEGPRFHCKLCLYSTNHKSHYDKHLLNKKHLRLCGNAAITESSNEAVADVNCNPAEKGDSENVCDVCSLDFDTPEVYYEHRINHIPLSEAELLKQCDGDELKHCPEKYHAFVKQLPADPKSESPCPECGKTFSRTDIVVHLRSHANVTPFSCIYCDKSFSKGTSLRLHIGNVHLPSKRHKCQYCEQSYPTKIQIQQHILGKHSDKVDFKPLYVCEECGCKFMAGFLFRKHLNTHNKIRPFRCPWKGCVRCFPTKSSMEVHMRSHTKERPYLCDLCGFSASTSAQLNRHRRIHTGDRRYKCEYCTYGSVTASGLLRHLRIHTGSTAYRCPHCSFRTPDWGRLNKHVRYKKDHKGLYLYNCHLCAYKSMACKDFRDHLFTSHGLNTSVQEASVLARVYDKEGDRNCIGEGQRVIPVQEKFVKGSSKYLYEAQV